MLFPALQRSETELHSEYVSMFINQYFISRCVCVDVLSDLIHDEEPFPPLNAFNFLSAIIFSDILSLFPLFILRITPRRLSRTHIVAVQ